jgi:hypothetical protein
MVRTKIINISGCETCKEVTLIVQRDEEGTDYIEITAWHEVEEGITHFQQARVDFNEFEDQDAFMESYIKDFSEHSANTFANSFIP